MSDSKTLLSLIESTASLEEMLVQSGGEITEEIESALSSMEVDLPEKVDNYALTIERFETVAAFYKQRAEIFLKMARSASGVADFCKENMKLAMNKLETTELVGVDMKFKLVASNPSVVIEDQTQLDGAYVITETITSPDKKRIAEDLKLGVPVKGARLERGMALRKLPNTPAKQKQVKA